MKAKKEGLGQGGANSSDPWCAWGAGGVVSVWLYLLHQKATVSGQEARVPAGPPVPGTVAGPEQTFSYTAVE